VDGFLDIYSKLLIALISFTAPLITLILSIPSKDLTSYRDRLYEEFSQSATLMGADTSKYKSNPDAADMADKGIAGLISQKKRIQKTLKLLDPKRQVVRIFSALAVSLLFLIAYKFEPDKMLNICSHCIGITLIVISLLSFAYTIYLFKEIAWVAIDAKQSIPIETPSTTIEAVPENGI
jgi:hypothetical protein